MESAMLKTVFHEVYCAKQMPHDLTLESSRFCTSPMSVRQSSYTSKCIMAGGYVLGHLLGKRYFAGVFFDQTRKAYEATGWKIKVVKSAAFSGATITSGLWDTATKPIEKMSKNFSKLYDVPVVNLIEHQTYPKYSCVRDWVTMHEQRKVEKVIYV
jgi:N-acyl-L-homoserine lactone synthetase